MKKNLFIPVLLLSISYYSCNQKDMEKKNILLTEFSTPHNTVPFDIIKFEDYRPAFDTAIKEARAAIDEIIKNPRPASFENTIEALEKSEKLLDRISGIFFNLNEANTSDSMQHFAQEISPVLTEYSNDIFLNQELFNRIKVIKEKKDDLNLTKEQLMLLDKYYKAFVRNGVNLNDQDKEKFRQITSELSTLTLKFDENVLAETNAFELHLTDTADLAGLPSFVVESAAEEAKTRNKEGWIFTLHYPSYVPFMQYSEKRELREKMYRAYNSKGFHGNDKDNKEIVKRISELRLQLAKLLGYNNYAAFVLEERMAETPEKVHGFLNELLDKSMPFAKEEFNEVQSFARSMGADFEIQRWDWAYYSEKLKKQKYSVNDEITRPYFKLENVQKGVFDLATTLFDITFKENQNIPVYNPDVKALEVYDKNNRFLAVLYLDFFPRQSKQGGAWATNFLSQYKEDGNDVRPHVSLVFNFTKPTSNNPSLLTYDQVTTFLHEFGHSLHYILSECTYKTLSGTSVYRDFVELPSQIMENWAQEKEWLDKVAVHYQTGEKIPEELVNKIIESSNFLAGYASVRQLTFGMNDMAWHTITSSVEIPVEEFEKKAISKTELFGPIEGCNISTQFGHIFAGGYAAGYYSYKWAEVLDADAFLLFKKNGIFDKETAKSFRDNILSKGGTEHPMGLYVKFRGQEPTIDALLERSGLVKQL